ncbi:Transmembrane protein [Ceratobasidium theobromae]|uniref:Transmembrane protein n=1 Tax=Ceratobasidium theobromae TaxID=1582974 RepID=A0A5N5QBG8_9AGAM|nr:Transmembrane protein [Ceratobasidium theobromae]
MPNTTFPSYQPEYTPIPLIHSDLGALGTAVVASDKSPNKPKPVRRKARGTFIDWLKTLQPLIIHFIVTVLITILVLFYINGNNFLLDESTRRPLAKLADGTQVPTSQYILLQSDITTIVSAMIVVLNWAALGWATALYWRSSFLIMEKIGLRRRDLKWITRSGVVHPTGYFRYDLMSFIGILLLLTLVPQYSSPLLTGAISWAPSSMLAKLSHDIAMNLSAAGFSSMAWDQEIEKGVFKRVLPGASQLSVGTIISNVTIPIFWVSDIDWFTNETEVGLFIEGYTESQFGLTEEYQFLMQGLSTFGLDAETRVLVINASTTKKRGGTDCLATDNTIALRFPTNTSFFQDHGWCFAAARVTYHMGAGKCHNCQISSLSTVQNTSAITLQPDLIKFLAAPTLGNVTNYLNMFNASLPSLLNNANDYITEVLSRAYSGVWTTVAETTLGNTGAREYSTNYSPALSSLQARVDLRRVYAWLALQLSVTVAGVAFLAVQSRSRYPLVGDTSMIAFDLDTNDAPKDFPGLSKDRRLMWLGPKENGWKVVA